MKKKRECNGVRDMYAMCVEHTYTHTHTNMIMGKKTTMMSTCVCVCTFE